MAVVDASQMDRTLSGMRQGHAGTPASPEDTFVGNLIILGLAAKVLGRNLLQLLSGVHRRRMRRAGHGMGRLAATGRAGPWQVLRRVAPCDFALFPRHAENLSDHAMDIGPRLRSEIAHAGLDIDLAIGFDDE